MKLVITESLLSWVASILKRSTITAVKITVHLSVSINLDSDCSCKYRSLNKCLLNQIELNVPFQCQPRALLMTTWQTHKTPLAFR